MKIKFVLTLLATLICTSAFAASAYKTDYESVAPSATTQTLGPVGAAGDILETLVVNVTTTGTSNVAIKDGSLLAVTVVPVNTPVGSYSLHIGARSVSGAWQVTTGAGASVIAVGSFR